MFAKQVFHTMSGLNESGEGRVYHEAEADRFVVSIREAGQLQLA